MITAKSLLAYILQAASAFGSPIDTADINHEEAYCLAQNVFYEARGEPISGQFAVASVTLNRANDSRYPDTICGVVKQGSGRSCAFSWTCDSKRVGREISVKNADGSVNHRVAEQFKTASMVAVAAMAGAAEDKTRGATHFHNKTVKPMWATRLIRTVTIGNHTFYRYK